MNNPNLTIAEWYLKIGWSLIPIVPETKTPAIAWKEFQQRRATLEEVKKWLQEGWHLAVVTGDVSNLCVLDDDRVKHGLKEWGFTSSIVSKTKNNSYHYFFTYDRELHSHSNALIRVDLKAWHSYCLLPPFNGRSWVSKPSKDNLARLTPLPDDFVRLINSDTKNENGEKKPIVLSDFVAIKDGARNDSLHKVACSLFTKTSEEEALQILAGLNQTYDPPLTQSEFQYQVSRAKNFIKSAKATGTNNSESEWGPNTYQEKIYSEYEWGPVSYPEWGVPEILEVLGRTIKKDDFNKVLVFLCQLLAYTADSQINLSFNSPSSSGKSYLALETAELFPVEDVMRLGYASPTSFFHTSSAYDKEKNAFIVDLERKIVIFLDMPHSQLLEHLRPVLSHDQKEVLIKVTDKNRRGGIKTKDIILRGYPAVLFCTASFNFDEQELTRFIILSPETSQEKFRESVFEKVRKETNLSQYQKELLADAKRQELKKRIQEIKKVNVQEIRIGTPDKLLQMFYERNSILKPRSARDIQKISSLIKAFALLNCWNRDHADGAIITTESDLINAFKIWDEISLAQELGVSPYILSIYKEIIVPAFEANGKKGVSRQELVKKHYQVYGRHLPDWQLRQEIIPMLETAGLLAQEANPLDKRQMLVWPQVSLTISPRHETVSNGIKKMNVGKETFPSNNQEANQEQQFLPQGEEEAYPGQRMVEHLNAQRLKKDAKVRQHYIDLADEGIDLEEYKKSKGWG